jgi:hypothetical protein
MPVRPAPPTAEPATMPQLSRRQLVSGAALAATAAALHPTAATAAPPPADRGRERTADVVVVAAGLAGLSAARTLTGAGRSVVVLEARDRVGGRTLNHRVSGGHVADLGGTWIGPTQNAVAALAAELGLATFAQVDDGDAVYYRDGVRTTYPSGVPPGARRRTRRSSPTWSRSSRWSTRCRRRSPSMRRGPPTTQRSGTARPSTPGSASTPCRPRRARSPPPPYATVSELDE